MNGGARSQANFRIARTPFAKTQQSLRDVAAARRTGMRRQVRMRVAPIAHGPSARLVRFAHCMRCPIARPTSGYPWAPVRPTAEVSDEQSLVSPASSSPPARGVARAQPLSYQIEEVYSNADGSVQFVVLRETDGLTGQQGLAGRQLTVTRPNVAKTFTFPGDLPSTATANARVLVGSVGFQALGLIAPDYVFPDRFLPVDGATLALSRDRLDHLRVVADRRLERAVPRRQRPTERRHEFRGPERHGPAATGDRRRVLPRRARSPFREPAGAGHRGARLRPVDGLGANRWHVRRVGERPRRSRRRRARCAASTSRRRRAIRISSRRRRRSARTSRSGSRPIRTMRASCRRRRARSTSGFPNTTTGACAAGTVPVYRLWNQRADSNHRYTIDRAVRDQMVAAGYVAEGYGTDPVAMCAPFVGTDVVVKVSDTTPFADELRAVERYALREQRGRALAGDQPDESAEPDRRLSAGPLVERRGARQRDPLLVRWRPHLGTAARPLFTMRAAVLRRTTATTSGRPTRG